MQSRLPLYASGDLLLCLMQLLGGNLRSEPKLCDTQNLL
jgi:hypothetical protein